jgi:hypothetical protein
LRSQWVLGSPALQDLETAHPFFRPVINEIAKHILSIADFGLKMRLFSGAGLSVFDLISDVYMIVVFLGSEETRGVAYVNIVCVALSLLAQLFIAWFVNRKRPWRRIVREAMYVVLFIKPGIDAARVAGGGENDDGLATVDSLAELTFSKGAEMVFESIPAGAHANHYYKDSRWSDPSPPNRAQPSSRPGPSSSARIGAELPS